MNAILDPIFIFALDMNLAGAALASVATRIGAARDEPKPKQRERGANASGASTAPGPFASLTLGPNVFGKGLVKGLVLIA